MLGYITQMAKIKVNLSNEMTRDSVFTFGKHKGFSLEEIATFDPGYVCWVYEEVDRVQIPEDIYIECDAERQEENEDHHQSRLDAAAEYNSHDWGDK